MCQGFRAFSDGSPWPCVPKIWRLIVTLVPSINPPHQIDASGFERAASVAHMIAWLGRGSDFQRFVANDLETELYRQTPGAQLLAVWCQKEPELTTTAMQSEDGQGIVTDLSVTFPVTIRVRAEDGAIWKLDIEHSYHATNVHLNDGRRTISLDVRIMAHFQEK